MCVVVLINNGIVVSFSQADDSEQVSEFLSKADRKLAALESGEISVLFCDVYHKGLNLTNANFAATFSC